jgi:hypothetical protein
MKDVSGQVNIIFDKEAESVHSKLGEKFYNKLSDKIWVGVAENLNPQIGTTSWRVIRVLRNQVK